MTQHYYTADALAYALLENFEGFKYHRRRVRKPTFNRVMLIARAWHTAITKQNMSISQQRLLYRALWNVKTHADYNVVVATYADHSMSHVNMVPPYRYRRV